MAITFSDIRRSIIISFEALLMPREVDSDIKGTKAAESPLCQHDIVKIHRCLFKVVYHALRRTEVGRVIYILQSVNSESSDYALVIN